MRRQIRSKNIDVWPKIPKIGHPFIINLLHIKDQFPQLVLSTSVEETTLYGKTIHMHAGRLQHIQGEGLGKGYIIINYTFNTFYRYTNVTPWSVRSVLWTAHSCAAHGSQNKMMGITKGIVVIFLKRVCLLTKLQTYKFQQN